jgi:hypothetical protein
MTFKGRTEMDTGFWLGTMKESDHLEDIGVEATIILKWMLNRYDGRTWTRLIWFSIKIGGPLWTDEWNYGATKRK